MLVLNVGGGGPGLFMEKSLEEIENQVTSNTIHPIYLLKQLLPQLLSRPHRSAVIFTSSIAAHRSLPGLIPYSSAKSAVTFLSTALSFELPTLDFLSYNPGEVQTNSVRLQASGKVVTAKSSVAACLRDLGREEVTNGCARHELMAWFTVKLPGVVLFTIVGG